MVEKLKNNSIGKPKRKGGARPNAGRKRGGMNQASLEKMAVRKEIEQRIMRKASRIHDAQYALAVGAYSVFRIEEDEHTKKRKHVLVTSDSEIARFLDECNGDDGAVGNDYYIIEKQKADNRALDSMLDRVFGKPATTVEIEQNNESKQQISKLFAVLLKALEDPNRRPVEQVAEAIKGYCRLKGLDAGEIAAMVREEVQQIGGVQ